MRRAMETGWWLGAPWVWVAGVRGVRSGSASRQPGQPRARSYQVARCVRACDRTVLGQAAAAGTRGRTKASEPRTEPATGRARHAPKAHARKSCDA